MSANSKIEWTHSTFNAWWGCVEDGPECDHCYARSFAKRTGHNVWGLGERRFFGDAHWSEPLKWNRDAAKAGERRRVFCGSMMDVFERRNDAVGDKMNEARARLWDLIGATPHLDWLLLTKRPQNIPSLAPAWAAGWVPRNVWLGTTAGNRAGWEKRVKYLRHLNPVVRFVSVEPQLEDLGDVDLTGISWVIQGGESGGGARPFEMPWAASLRDQCKAAGVAYFFKQAGAKPYEVTPNAFDPRGKPSLRRLALVSGKGGDLTEIPGDWPREFPTPRMGAAAE